MVAPAAKAAEVLAKSAANLQAAHKTAMNAAAKAAKDAVLDELDTVTSGRRLRNVGKSGGKLSVGYDVSTVGEGARAKVKAKGPWQIIERDTGAHTIRPRKKGKKKALRLPSGGFRRAVPHPGTRGKHPFEKGFQRSQTKVPKALDQHYRKAVGRAWS